MSEKYFLKRIEKLRGKLAEIGGDGMIVSSLAHIRYLCGFTGSSATLVVSLDSVHFITDGRYVFQSESEVKGANIIIDSKPHIEVIKHQNIFSNGQKIAFDSNAISHSAYIDMSTHLSFVGLIETTAIIEQIAAIKDKDEIQAIKTAVEITDFVFEKVFPMVKIGVQEKEISTKLSYLYRLHGDADSDAFAAIVGSGPNSAKPHHKPTDRKIGPGELIVIDSGAKFAGYHADMTRSFATKGFSDKQKEIYDIVLSAQVESIKQIKSGVPCVKIDSVARDIISDKGYGKYFDHGLGHSLGLQIHENPRFSKVSKDILQAGNVMTVEPGIYVDSIGGVRIEDDVVVTNEGYEILNKTPKDFTVIS